MISYTQREKRTDDLVHDVGRVGLEPHAHLGLVQQRPGVVETHGLDASVGPVRTAHLPHAVVHARHLAEAWRKQGRQEQWVEWKEEGGCAWGEVKDWRACCEKAVEGGVWMSMYDKLYQLKS